METFDLWGGAAPAKRRLALEGPLDPGTDAARRAAIVVAAELKVQGAPIETAQAIVQEMPFTPGNTPERKVRRQLIRSVRWAYNPPDGQPVLTGCCRDTRPHCRTQTARLRQVFEPYCDEECERSCPMLRASRNPVGSLHGTPYEPIIVSDIWTNSGGGFGTNGERVYALIAGLAVVSGTDKIRVSSRFLTMKLEGRITSSQIRRILKKMGECGLVPLLYRPTALRHVPALTLEEIVSLEKRLGVYGAHDANIREARRESDDYLSWLAEVQSPLDDVALAAWDPSPQGGE
jgi:hypothetical protein